MGARYYDPETSEFLSPDPYGYTGSTNLYAFANGDPINYHDPDGRLFQPALQTIGAVIPTSAHDYGSLNDYNKLHRSIANAYEAQLYGSQIINWKDKLQKPWVPFYASHKAKQYLGANPYIAGTTPIAADVISGVGKAKDLSRFASKFPNVVKNILEHRAALKSSNYSQFLAKNFYLDAGFTRAAMLDHLGGINFSEKVNIRKLGPETIAVQWRNPGDSVGNYFSPYPADNPNLLGIHKGNRIKEMYSPKNAIHVLESRAAPIIDTWTSPGISVKVKGGGLQWFSLNPKEWRKL